MGKIEPTGPHAAEMTEPGHGQKPMRTSYTNRAN